MPSNIMHKTLLALIAMLLLPAQVSGETLLDFYRDAVVNDPALARAVSLSEGSLQQLDIARGALLPQVGFTASLNAEHARTNNERVTLKSDTTTHSQALNFSQALYRQDLKAQRETAGLETSAADSAVRVALNDIGLRVTQAVVDVQIAKEDIRFKQYENQVLGQRLQESRALKQEGMATITDVQQYQSEYDLSVAALIEAEDLLNRYHNELAEITGHFPLNAQALTLPQQSRINTVLKQGVNFWINQALKNNADVASSRIQLDIAESKISQRKSERLPRIDLTATLSNDVDQLDSGDVTSRTGRIGMELDLPLFSGFASTAKIKLAKFERQRVEVDQQSSTRRVLKDLRLAYGNMSNGVRRISSLKRAMHSTQQALEGVKRAADLGTRTALDVNLAVQSWYDARRAYSRARYHYILNGITVLSLAGVLEESDLAML